MLSYFNTAESVLSSSPELLHMSSHILTHVHRVIFLFLYRFSYGFFSYFACRLLQILFILYFCLFRNNHIFCVSQSNNIFAFREQSYFRVFFLRFANNDLTINDNDIVTFPLLDYWV